jgi:hypothetical protein
MTAFGTMKVFGAYLILLGVVGMLVPNLLTNVIGMPESRDVWGRVTGMLVFNLGILYGWIIWTRSTAMIRFTVVTRLFVLVCLSAFALAGLAHANIIGFGIVDALGALWTESALRREARLN